MIDTGRVPGFRCFRLCDINSFLDFINKICDKESTCCILQIGGKAKDVGMKMLLRSKGVRRKLWEHTAKVADAQVE